MKSLLTIVIGFLHDFAAGCWAATVFASYWLDRHPFPVALAVHLTGLKLELFRAGIFSLFVVLASGAGRSFTYIPNVYGEMGEARRRRLLAIKHVLLMALFGLGSWWQYQMINNPRLMP